MWQNEKTFQISCLFSRLNQVKESASVSDSHRHSGSVKQGEGHIYMRGYSDHSGWLEHSFYRGLCVQRTAHWELCMATCVTGLKKFPGVSETVSNYPSSRNLTQSTAAQISNRRVLFFYFMEDTRQILKKLSTEATHTA